MTLIELVVAAGVASAVAVLGAATLVAALHQIRNTGRMQAALVLADNVLDTCLALPGDQASGQELQRAADRCAQRSRLPGVAVAVHVDQDGSDPSVDRLTVRVRWQGGGDGVWLAGFRFLPSARDQQ